MLYGIQQALNLLVIIQKIKILSFSFFFFKKEKSFPRSNFLLACLLPEEGCRGRGQGCHSSFMDETEGWTARTESKDSSCSWPGLLLHAVLPLGHSLGRGRGLLLTVNWDHDQMWTDCQRACEGGMYFHSSQGGALGPNLQPCLTLLGLRI